MYGGRRSPIETCRVCLTTNPVHRSVFDYLDDERLHINEMISRVSSVHMQKNELFPDNICVLCFEDAKSAYSFRKRCMTSEDALNNRYVGNGYTVLKVKEEPTEFNMNPLQNDANVENHRPWAAVAKNGPKRQMLKKDKLDKIIGRLKHSKASDTVLECDSCDFEASTSNKLKTHIKNVHNDTYACKICRKRCPPSIHANVAGEEYTCEECDYVRRTMHLFKLHSEATSMYNYAASQVICELGIKSEMDDVDGRYACDVCDYVAKRRNLLKKHMIKHDRVMKYTCDMCEYASKRRSDMVTHLVKHRTERKYMCPMCDYVGKARNHLHKHMVTHQREKKYTCDSCDYASKRRSDMTKHVKTHKVHDRRFVCVA